VEDQHGKMKSYQIALIVTFAVLVLGILLSIFLNSLFLFFFLPFGFAWGFGRKRKSSSVQQEEEEEEGEEQRHDSIPYSSPAFCAYCGSRLVRGNPYCPSCGRVTYGSVGFQDLR
jgi:flagellar basal body-associated protein FliL